MQPWLPPCITAVLMSSTQNTHPTHLQWEELWQMPLAQRLPGRSLAQVKDKCCAMVEFAIRVRRPAL